MASVTSRQATARNIADSAVTRLQPISNTRSDAAVVWDHETFRATFGFQPINGGEYIILPTDKYWGQAGRQACSEGVGGET